MFIVSLEAEPDSPRGPRTYSPGPNGEDYNQYDESIAQAVDEWNKKFITQADPPPVFLDPDLVKAIIYVESDVGYYRTQKGYSGYPDIMQVADPRNDAIYALKNIRNPNRNKQGTEYEVTNGKLAPIEYPEASGNSPESSIYWGVRWLYHVAQMNIEKSGVWKREWRKWKEAVNMYNKGGDANYVQKSL